MVVVLLLVGAQPCTRRGGCLVLAFGDEELVFPVVRGGLSASGAFADILQVRGAGSVASAPATDFPRQALQEAEHGTAEYDVRVCGGVLGVVVVADNAHGLPPADDAPVAHPSLARRLAAVVLLVACEQAI